ncbi:DUF397 domain-containing protein [Catenuloplanes indicus]|uniref:DUF397 domain-containing protein n=1 Tax=Catenuloplanes indicus TaxID=137267 RepID=UPI0027D77CD1|nr:DUF397 domain-containing protein [Catenuloplanes indicus]
MNRSILTRGRWTKSSRSELGDCVEVRAGEDAVDIRDSKHPSGHRLSVSGAAWTAFVRTIV